MEVQCVPLNSILLAILVTFILIGKHHQQIVNTLGTHGEKQNEKKICSPHFFKEKIKDKRQDIGHAQSSSPECDPRETFSR